MHIPDGYLSPATAAVMYAATVPFWYRASQKIKSLIAGRFIPLIALLAAVSFVIMMFNVPLPGGTTGHAVGAALAAILVGPWAAGLAISVALFIQALFFGDGGILAFGANAFNLAIAMPFVAFYLYRAISGNAPFTSSRRVIAAGIAGYVSINVAALLTAIELGIQPILFRDASGRALYFPYDLSIAIPAMMLGHLTFAGLAEAIVTALAVAWVQRTNSELLQVFSGAPSSVTARGLPRWAWGALVVLVILTPIGLLAPGTAWGEWGREELEALGLGYIPAGFDEWSNLWRAPIPDYDIPALAHPTLAYLASAALGVIIVIGVIYALGWFLARVTRAQVST